MPLIRDSITKQTYDDPNAQIVQMGNKRYAWVSNSPFREGTVNYKFAKKSEFIGDRKLEPPGNGQETSETHN